MSDEALRERAALLTRREREVWPLLAHGLTTAQVGARLHRAEKTIERHGTSLATKLRVSGRVRVVMAWVRWEAISGERCPCCGRAPESEPTAPPEPSLADSLRLVLGAGS